MSPAVEIRPPATRGEWNDYYELRYSILRRPWKISEALEADEAGSFHLAAFDLGGTVLGTGRLVPLSEAQGQIRSMAVSKNSRKTGVGRTLLRALELEALHRELHHLILHGREEAVPFYKRCGYRLVEPSYLLQDIIQHYRMERFLDKTPEKLDFDL